MCTPVCCLLTAARSKNLGKVITDYNVDEVDDDDDDDGDDGNDNAFGKDGAGGAE